MHLANTYRLQIPNLCRFEVMWFEDISGDLGTNVIFLIMCPQIEDLKWLSPSRLALHLPLLAWELILSELSVLCVSSSTRISLHFPVLEWKTQRHQIQGNIKKVLCSSSVWFLSFDTLTFKFHCKHLKKIHLFCMGCPCLSSLLAKSWRCLLLSTHHPLLPSYPLYRSLGFQILLIFLVLLAHEKKSICPLGERVKNSPAV